MTYSEKFTAAINKYVAKFGFDSIKSKGEILDIAGMSNAGDSVFPSDYSYNRYNNGLGLFDGAHLFERMNSKEYRILGENYPYTGPVYHRPSGGAEYVCGYWENGVLQWLKVNGNEMSNEYIADLKAESEKINSEVEDLPIQGTDKDAIVKVRINQSKFRERLFSRYKHCCLCPVSNESLLIASHIKPWCDATCEERVDINNGFLLCPNHDRLFDKGYITFDDNGHIMISESLDKYNRISLNVDSSMKIEVCYENKKYLEFHRKNVFIR